MKSKMAEKQEHKMKYYVPKTDSFMKCLLENTVAANAFIDHLLECQLLIDSSSDSS